MKLEKIGFYTLEDNRAKNADINSPLWRNELIITSRCNFNCPYCRGTDINGNKGDMSFDDIKNTINIWANDNLQNIRFSGGEPTLHPYIKDIIKYTKEKCKNIKHIAVSTNGYNNFELYKELIEIGVNDYSISLDACCSSIGDMMAGGIKGAWVKVVDNIKKLSEITYVTVGVVLTPENIDTINDIVEYAHNLGVADIRLITAAQWNDFEAFKKINIKEEILDSHPILKYRVNHFNIGRNVRGIKSEDFKKCGLILDDMIVKGKYHYPCVIKMREGCKPIGELNKNSRKDRYEYFKNHNCFTDEICKNNCLDVCIDYNNKYIKFQCEKSYLPKLDSTLFTSSEWASGQIADLGIECRYDCIIHPLNKQILQKYAIGWCYGENLMCRPKENQVAVMFKRDDKTFWFHLRNSEFFEVFVNY